MEPIQYRMHVRGFGIVLVAILLSACSSFGGGTAGSRQQISIDSEPQNATVYAGDTVIGETPLSINPGEVFESRFTAGGGDSEGIVAFRYVGTLAIKKPGCKSYTTQVDDHILSRDIHVKLECDPDYRPAQVQPAAPRQAPAAVAPATRDMGRDLSAGSAEERLQRIESLYIKGLLSDEEYRTLRQRVMDTL